MVDKKLFNRNVKIIRKKLKGQIDHSLEKGNKYIDKELSGPFNLLLREAVKLYYNGIKKQDMARGTSTQIDVTLAAGKEAALNPNKDLDEIIDKYYSQYLKADQTTRALRKSHKNYKWCVENQKKTFKAQIESLVPMLLCEAPNIDSYFSLVKATFKTHKKTMDALMKQRPYMEAGINKIAEDKTILDLPMGREILFNVLKGGYSETWDELEEEVNNIDFDN
ncbi:MAG: hypothetical protein GF364_10905 [Candidatus Lokiarchaeota archaeon]|nr:hypothetical protein [Candidatus Lokiarchaeota archaeon]